MSKRLTTEEFIKKAKEKHGDKYDYSKVDYKNSQTKVCIICPKHGEFWQRPSEHLRGYSCLKCCNEDKTLYTKEKCIEISKQGLSYQEFRKNNYVAYRVSREKGWLSEMTWLKSIPIKHRPIYDLKNNLVYCYEFPDKVVYIGRTNNLKRRDKEHRNEHKYSKDKSRVCTVLRYSRLEKLEIPKPKILKENLTLFQSREEEDNFCQKYKDDGYTLLNISKTGIECGSLGGYTRYDSYDEVLEKARECSSRSDFYRKFRGMYDAAKKLGFYEKLAEDCSWPKSISVKPIIVHDSSGTYIGTFQNLKEACKFAKVNYSNVSEAMSHKKDPTVKGFIFKKVND